MKKLLAILLVAMIAASVAVVPVSAVEVSDNTIIEACQSYTEDVVEYLQDRGKNSNIKRLFFEYTGDKKPTTQTLVYDIPAVEHVVAEYEVAGKRKYYYVYRPDGEFTNVIPGTTTGNEPTYEVRPLLNYYGTLVYDYETNEVHSIETTLTSEDLSARKELIEDTVIPFFTENNENTPLKVYSLQIDDNTIQNLVEYQTSSGNFCRTVNYNLKTGELELASNSAISIKSYAPAFVSPDSVIYDCSTGTARINEFNGTYLFSSSESETTPTNSESTSPTVSETESPSTNEPSTTTPKNGWVKESSAWYVYRNDQLLKNQWYQDGSKWYYLDDTGAMVTGWKDVAGKKYHFDSSGVMQTGWKLVDGSWHYFKGSGEMATGWLQVTSGSPWYYLKSDGKMVTGWMQIGNKWYCFKSNGEMYANTTTPDGYQVGSDGAMIEDSSEEGTSGNEDSVIFDEDYLDFSHGDTTYFFGAYYPEDVATATTLVAAMARHYADNPFTFSVNYALCYECSADEYLVAISTNSKTSKDNPNLAMLCAIYNKKENHVMFTDEWTDLDYLRADIALNEFNRWYFSENTLTRALNALGWF